MFRYMKRALAGVWSFRGVCVLCALAAVVVNGTHHSYIMERCTDTSRPTEFRKILRGSEKLKDGNVFGVFEKARTDAFAQGGVNSCRISALRSLDPQLKWTSFLHCSQCFFSVREYAMYLRLKK
ncbi:uncharacterized protein LOC125759751 [Rhipicephalus sanguineus]|uniref:uncharacterized protein LOC125759751 n=1 Tax=Rhipicephalus sanguineus TaxID=34632 RepID=UPI0020C1DFE8|nr:uncharacterized protein LOC125759751 [Rhipicephalus sanguineus]